ncbi:MAG: NAD(P)/FAD-dependent oxidoreductase [Polyangiaceae bacterium]
MKLKKSVVVVGGGFGGLAVARELADAPVHVTLIDRSNHHLFQPLLYQVAMAGLSPAEIAVPIRSVLRRQSNTKVLLAEVVGIDFDSQRVLTRECPPIEYDYLVLAPGAKSSYFGHDEWSQFAPGLKDLDDAVEIRRRVLLAFEAAERESDPIQRRRHLTFVVIGGGPTGVELAGAIAELATYVLARDFRAITPDATKVILVEGGPRVLPTFDETLSERATRSMADMGIEVRTQSLVTSLDETGVDTSTGRIDASTVLWAAGVRASDLGRRLGFDVDRQGRVRVSNDCSIPGRQDVFCIGDAALYVPEGSNGPLPGISPVAIQQGRFVARQIARSTEGKPREVFRYKDKGTMATIGRSRAIAQLGRLRLSGFLAWAAWLLVHIFYLIDFRNRSVVLFNWAWSYVTYQRGSRLITGHRLDAGTPIAATGPVADLDMTTGAEPIVKGAAEEGPRLSTG